MATRKASQRTMYKSAIAVHILDSNQAIVGRESDINVQKYIKEVNPTRKQGAIVNKDEGQ